MTAEETLRLTQIAATIFAALLRDYTADIDANGYAKLRKVAIVQARALYFETQAQGPLR